jgi:ribosomal protein L24E
MKQELEEISFCHRNVEKRKQFPREVEWTRTKEKDGHVQKMKKVKITTSCCNAENVLLVPKMPLMGLYNAKTMKNNV